MHVLQTVLLGRHILTIHETEWIVYLWKSPGIQQSRLLSQGICCAGRICHIREPTEHRSVHNRTHNSACDSVNLFWANCELRYPQRWRRKFALRPSFHFCCSTNSRVDPRDPAMAEYSYAITDRRTIESRGPLSRNPNDYAH